MIKICIIFFCCRFIFGCLWVLITFLECCFFVYQRVYTYRDSTLGLVKIHKKGIYVLLLLPLCILFVCSMVTLLVIRRCPYIQATRSLLISLSISFWICLIYFGFQSFWEYFRVEYATKSSFIYETSETSTTFHHNCQFFKKKYSKKYKTQQKNISISSQVKQQFEITLKTDDPVKYIRNVVNIL